MLGILFFIFASCEPLTFSFLPHVVQCMQWVIRTVSGLFTRCLFLDISKTFPFYIIIQQTLLYKRHEPRNQGDIHDRNDLFHAYRIEKEI